MDEYSDGLWYAEHDASDGTHYYSVRTILYNGETHYREVKILVTEEWGKTLVLDGDIRSTEFDKLVFHEALVHPAMIAHDNPRSVLIIGGDDGAGLREVLAHGSVESVVMTGIDEELVEICGKFLQEWSEGSFENPCVDLVFDDVADYLTHDDEKYDVIIADLSEFEDEESSIDLKSDVLYQLLRARLADDGIIVIHGIDFDAAECSDYLAYRSAIEGVFSLVRNYTANVPSFRGETMFMIASNTVDPAALSKTEIERRLGLRGCNADKDLGVTLHFYDADTHIRMFSIPKNVKTVFNGRRSLHGG